MTYQSHYLEHLHREVTHRGGNFWGYGVHPGGTITGRFHMFYLSWVVRSKGFSLLFPSPVLVLLPLDIPQYAQRRPSYDVSRPSPPISYM